VSRLGPAWFGIPPALAILVGLPLVGSPFARGPDGGVAPWALVGVPVWLALLAAPGYAACLAVEPARLRRTASGRAWIRGSLAVLLACALLGAWAGTVAFAFALPSLATAACCVVLAWRFERAGHAEAGGADR
jgi:hypothetical protein